MKNSIVQYLDIIEKRFPDKVAIETDVTSITFSGYRRAALSVASFIMKKIQATENLW